MLILTTEQIREADRRTIERQGISSAELMERAAGKCTQWLTGKFGSGTRYTIVCGPGNNGGDGLVIARQLGKQGFNVNVWTMPAEQRSPDNLLNLERARAAGIEPMVLSNDTSLSALVEETDVLVDALFGRGLNRPLEGDPAGIVAQLNHLQGAIVVSVDLPSGFFADKPMPEKAPCIEADYTLCFHAPAQMLFFPESYRYTGQWEVLDIGLEPDDESSFLHYTLLPDILPFIPARRATFAHKGTYGHALLAGGSYGKTGALILAARACLRSGAGLTTVLAPRSSYTVLQAAIPEAMFTGSEEEDHLSGMPKTERFSAIGFGPGAGTHNDTARLLKQLIQQARQSFVIDADGLNILAENPTWLAFLPPNTILTPHPGEFDRLAGKAANGYERLEKAKELTLKNNCIVVLKGAYTAVVLPNGTVHFNSTGNPGMATGGSGDVLTGLLTGLLAQGFPPERAALTGAFLHGLAGDLAAAEQSEPGMSAGDIAANIGQAWKRLQEAH